jgi:hypothetical protein
VKQNSATVIVEALSPTSCSSLVSEPHSGAEPKETTVFTRNQPLFHAWAGCPERRRKNSAQNGCCYD